MAHIHNVYDTDKHFLIDAVTMTIQNTSEKVKLSQYNHKSERFTFEMPRYIEGHDMSLCNKVEVHFNNIKSDKTAISKGVYEVDDLEVSTDDENTVLFSWLISRKATKNEGTLNFCIRFACVAEDATVEYARYTDIHKGITISESLFNSEHIIEDYSDIIEQWRKELFENVNFSAEWDNIKNKPFGEESETFDTVTFDGVIHEESIVTNSYENAGFEFRYIKVGELPCSSVEYISKVGSILANMGVETTFDISELDVFVLSNATILNQNGMFTLVVAIDEPGVIRIDEYEIPVDFPEAGLYFAFIEAGGTNLYVENITFLNLKKIDEKYMPITYDEIKHRIARLKDAIANATPSDYYDLKSRVNMLETEIKTKADSNLNNNPSFGILSGTVHRLDTGYYNLETDVISLKNTSKNHMEKVNPGFDGEFMRVVDGKWASVPMTYAEGVPF